MEKRLSRTEMLFTLGFLFMLVLAVGAFFYGVKIGSDKTEARFIEQTKHLSGGTVKNEAAYQQQDLVSFYHTVFLPYREFQTEWFHTIDKLTTGQLSDSASALKELTGLADQKYSAAGRSSFPASSPLLEQSQIQYMKSLKLFSKASSRAAVSTKNMKTDELIEALMQDAYYLEGVKQAMSGQLNYYTAMLKWSSTIDPHIPNQYDSTPVLQINAWKSLPLTVKNKLMADQLNVRKQFTNYYPQDLSARVDEFILSGQASKMKMKTVDSIVDLLISTEAIRSGDFANSKARLYANEILPQLSFFYTEQ